MVNAADNDHVYVVKKSGEVSSYAASAPQGRLFFKDSDIFYFTLNSIEATSETVVDGGFTVKVNKDEIKSFASSIIEVGIVYSWFHKEPVYGIDAWMKLGDSLKSDAYTFTIHGLDHGVTYYIRPYVKVFGKCYYGNVTSEVKTQGAEQTLKLWQDFLVHSTVEGVADKRLYFALYNVGSCTEGNPGAYFAWAETAPKDEYTWDNYKWGDGETFTKYVYQTTSLNFEDADDAVRAAMNAGSINGDFAQDVRSRCQTNRGLYTSWSTRIAPDGSEIHGCEVYNDYGDKMFIPAGGYMDGTNVVGYDTNACLWTSETYGQTSSQGTSFVGDSSGVHSYYDDISGKLRYLGVPMRCAYFKNEDEDE